MTDWANELPIIEVPMERNWSENYCFNAFDPAGGAGFWIHCGRWMPNPQMWREQILLFLPSGAFAIQRNYGRRDSANGPSGACLELICEKAAQRWRLRYSGPARRLTMVELQDAPVRAGALTLLSFDFLFDATGAIWDFGSTEDQSWATSHYEQPGRVVGQVCFDGETCEFKGVGHRDHSRGPRDLSNHAGHCWIQGHLIDQSFALMSVRAIVEGSVKSVFAKAVVFSGNRVLAAEFDNAPFLNSLEWPSPSYALTLNSSLGRINLIGRPTKTIIHSVAPTFECFDGLTPRMATAGVYQQLTTFEWNGQEAVGYTERSLNFGLDDRYKS